MMIISLMYVVTQRNMKCRIYEDDYETTVYDFSNNIRRREESTKVETFYSHIDE
jgi:hypothetical protein